jgi:acetyltransferase-like isoleucine patch superfamily enzyme
MKNKKLIIYGIGKFTDFICYSFKYDSNYTIVAQCVNGEYLSKATEIEHDFPLVNFDTLENNYDPEEYTLFITIGDDELRESIYKTAKLKGYNLATYISSNAVCPKNIELGDNVFIGEGTFIQPFVKIDDNTFVLAAKLGHHSIIGKNSLLSVCLLGAEVTVGDNCFIGLNSTIKPKTKIGRKNIIGMNCNITSNTEDKSIFSQPGTKKRGLTYDDLKGKYL